MKTPLRMCIVCRKLKPKQELIRLVKVGDKVVVDEKQKMQGRGVWISKDFEIIQRLKKTRALNRAFKCEVGVEVYDQVEKLCSQN